MIAFIMSALPGMTRRELMFECSYPELLIWFDRAIEIRLGEYEDEPDDSELDDKFVYNHETGRWE